METQSEQESAVANSIPQTSVLSATQRTEVPVAGLAEPPEANTAVAPNTTANDDELGPLKEILARGRYFPKVRSDSIIPTEGHEGILIAPKLYKGQAVAVYTSGGDASGL